MSWQFGRSKSGAGGLTLTPPREFAPPSPNPRTPFASPLVRRLGSGLPSLSRLYRTEAFAADDRIVVDDASDSRTVTVADFVVDTALIRCDQ